jgi:ABC-type transporter Mla MlaB component
MPEQQVEQHKDGVFGVIGDLTFDTVVHVEQEGLQAINASKQSVVFDLSTVQACSSAALALLLSWQRASQAKGLTISFKSPPQQLHDMIASAHLQAAIELSR